MLKSVLSSIKSKYTPIYPNHYISSIRNSPMLVQYTIAPEGNLLVREVKSVKISAGADAYDESFAREHIEHGKRAIVIYDDIFEAENMTDNNVESLFALSASDPIVNIPCRLFERIYYSMRHYHRKGVKGRESRYNAPELVALKRSIGRMEGDLISMLFESEPLGAKLRLCSKTPKMLKQWVTSRRNSF